MKKNNGASLAQYAIVLAVLSVSVIAVYGFLGQRTNSILLSYLGIFTANNAKVQSNAALLAQKGGSLSYTVNTIPAGSMGGTPDVPVQACVSGACTIDFGSYILSGVPEDFQEVVKNTGTSGGLDNIVDLMMQIADQIEQKGDIAGAQQFRDMANLGHFMATANKNREAIARECEAEGGGSYCYNSKRTLGDMIIPENLNFLTIKTFSSNDSIDIGSARHEKVGVTPEYFASVLLNKRPEYNFIDLYDKVQAISSFSPELKGISTELYLMVNDLQYNADYINRLAMSNNNAGGGYVYDPITGVIKSSYTSAGQGSSFLMSTLYSPGFAKGQHFNSSLICAAGKNVDIQDSCHK